MSKVAVVYWTGTGNTGAMAKAVLEGAKSAGAEADIFTSADIDATGIAAYDGVALGCPAMGDEVLEEDEFQPLYDSCKEILVGKKVGLFGSYGWGDGQWMRDWEEDCVNSGITLAAPYVMCNEEPDDDAITECQALGAALV